MKLKVEYLYEDMKPLNRKHTYDAGADCHMPYDVVIKPGKNIIPLGFKLVIPPGFAGFLSLRSSWMGSGIVCNYVPFDTGFSGEWNLIVYNTTNEDIKISKNERICQLIIQPIIDADFVDDLGLLRESNGVGSTGK